MALRVSKLNKQQRHQNKNCLRDFDTFKWNDLWIDNWHRNYIHTLTHASGQNARACHLCGWNLKRNKCREMQQQHRRIFTRNFCFTIEQNGNEKNNEKRPSTTSHTNTHTLANTNTWNINAKWMDVTMSSVENFGAHNYFAVVNGFHIVPHFRKP